MAAGDMARPATEDLVDALIREHLKRTGMLTALAAYDNERPRSSGAITSRSSLTRGLRIERLVKKHQDKNEPLPSLLYMVTSHLATRESSRSSPLKSDKQPSGISNPAVEADSTLVVVDQPRMQPRRGGGFGGPMMASTESDFAPRRAGRPGSANRGGIMFAGEEQRTTGSLAHARSEESSARRPATAGALQPHSSVELSQVNTTKSKELDNVDVARPLALAEPPAPAPKTVEPPPSGEKHGFKFSADEDFGSDFGGPSTFGVPQTAKVATNLSFEEARDVQALVLGRGSTFQPSWQQGLYWTSEEELKFGLWQDQGGPCGVIAAVQAFVLQKLVYEMPHARGRPGDESLLDPSDSQRDEALVLAMGHMLWQAGQRRRAVVCFRQGNEAVGSRNFCGSLCRYTFESLEETTDFLRSRLHVVKDENGAFVVLFMISALLSRGIAEVRGDMDVATNTMIAAHGYCSQEIVTLLLTGKAHSNVYDGEMTGMMTNDDGSDKPMKGILTRSDVGHLLLTEALNPGFIEVGSHYKHPRYPIYVICSESHYSILFSLDVEVSDPSNFPAPNDFDLFYYDELGRQDERIRLTIDPSPAVTPEPFDPNKKDMTPPIEHCIRTNWHGATVDWNGTDPLL